MEKNMAIANIFILMSAILPIYANQDQHNMDRRSCMKPACIDAASEIQQNLDPSIQPCDDFYSFVCGGFFQHTYIPQHKKGIDTFNNISDTVNEQTKIMLEETTGEAGPKAFKLVKKLYDACTNTAAIERDGLKTISHYLSECGGWPLLKQEGLKKDSAELGWIEVSTKLRKLGFGDYLISLYVEADPRNKTQRILTIGYPHLIARKDWTDEDREAYRNYLINVAMALGANKEEAEKEIAESSSFELQLANIQGQEQDRGMSIRELEFNYPGIPWLEFINSIVNGASHKVTLDDAVVVKSPQFVLNLIHMLKFAPKRTLTNYLMSRAVTSMVPFATETLRKEDLAFRKALHSSTEYDPRWKECLHVVTGRLSVATAAMYARKYFTDGKLNSAAAIANNVHNEFGNILHQIKWMDNSTKEHAFKKINAMAKFIGYPKELLDNKKIDTYYSPLETDSSSYLQLIKQLDLFSVDKHYKQLSNSYGEDKWAEQSYTNTIAAFYNPRENALQFPAGLLQGPFFNSEWPNYINYGVLGSLIGHEIIHGVDNQGKHYDEHGGLENWWSSTTESDYSDASTCINKYYITAGVPEIGLNVNNMNSQDEIIADLGGVKQAYLAYQKWAQQQNSAELPLPGLNYSPNQLFWISAANIWCAKFASGNGDFYSPSSFRVYEAFRNLDEFSKDFDCPVGANMNPKEKCSIW